MGARGARSLHYTRHPPLGGRMRLLINQNVGCKRLPLGRRALGEPQLEGIAHGQRGASGTLRNLRMFLNSATKLRAELPDKGRVVVSRDCKAIDPSLALNSGCLLFHVIAHSALPDRAGVLLLGESHVSGPGFIAQPVDEREMHHACLRIDLVPTPAPVS
jgi:hypothetical protein